MAATMRMKIMGLTMFRKALTSALAISVALGPIATAARADSYMFRYVSGLGIEKPAPVAPEEYGIGNDITAYYVAPVGYDFSKKIPVATRDVTDWRKDSGEMPSGIHLDEATGEMSGRPTTAGTSSLLYRGWDAAGSRIARAALNFTVFTPVGVGSELSFYAHTGTYFYETIPLPKGVDVYRWEPIVDYPAGMRMNGLAFEGTPEKAGTYAIAWRGYNFVGREVAFAFGELVVEDGPKIEHIADQTRDRRSGQWFNVRPVVKRSLGTLTYALVLEEGRPEGLSFSPDTGVLSGIYRTYNTSARFRIEVTDSADGRTSSSNTFTLATLPQMIDLSRLGDLEGTVNDYFWQPLGSGVADGEYSILEGVLPEGLQLGATNGYIYGTPKKKETQEGIVIGVSGNGVVSDRSQPFKFTVFPEAISADIVPLHARTNESFSTTAPKIRKGNVAPFTFSVAEGAGINDGLQLEAASGVISSAGISEPGTYDVTLSIRNGDGQNSKPLVQPISVHAPLDVSYSDVTVSRLKKFIADPVTDKTAIVGRARYTIDGFVPAWMTFDPHTGRLSGSPVSRAAERDWGPYVVTLRDDTGDTAESKPFTVKVEPREELDVAVVNDSAERFVPNQKATVEVENAYGTVRHSLTSGVLGGSLRITDSGVLVGATEDPVGTVYNGLVVTVRDDDDNIGKASDPFSITVVAPSDPKPLLGSFDGAALQWVEDTPFSLQLPELANGYGQVSYRLVTPSADVSVDEASGVLSGSMAEPGVYSFEYEISDEVPGRTPAKGVATITVLEPMTAAMEDEYPANVGAQLSIVPTLQNAIGNVTYEFSGILPEGLRYADGRITGAPRAEGTSGDLTLTITDGAGTKLAKTFRIAVGAALPFSAGYGKVILKNGSSAGLPMTPSATSSLGKMTYVHKSGTLPIGLRFEEGIIKGTPLETGTFTIVVAATDGGLDAESGSDDRSVDVTVVLEVAPAEDIAFSADAYTVRKGAQFSLDLSVSDGVAPLTFESASPDGIPHSLVLGPNGTLTGILDEAKTFDGIAVRVKDALGRSADATITLTAVDALSVSAPASPQFKQYAEGTAAVAAVNPAGTLEYAWSEGSPQPPEGLSLDTATGVISGTPEVFGEFAGYGIVVTDGFDGTSAASETFTISVAERDPLVLTPPAPLMLKRFSTASARAAVASPVGQVTYDVAPNLPEGIDLEHRTGEITGSSDDIVPTTVYTMTAADEKAGDLGTDVGTFMLEVAERDPLKIVVSDAIVFKQHAEESKGASAKDPVGEVQWEISPALPEGLVFANGIIKGTSHDVVPAATYTISAVDSKGGELGSDEVQVSISVEERDPLLASAPTSYGFSQFFEDSFEATVANVIGSVSWSFEPALPEWMIATVDEATGDLKISGTPAELMEPTTFKLTVADDHDTAEPVSVSVSVGERKPLKIEGASADGQPITLPGLIGYPFNTKLSAENAKGVLSWTLVSGTLPAGVEFDGAKGSFSGTVEEYGSFTDIVISAADEKGGFDQRTFTLQIGQDGSAIAVSATNPPRIHLGQTVTSPAPRATNAVGTAVFSATGLAGTGLTIDPVTGVISGTPKATGTVTAKVSVTDITQRIPEVPAEVQVTVLPPIKIEAASTAELVYNYDDPRPAPLAKESVPANIWALKSGRLPAGVSVDPSTGALVGKPKEVGTFGSVVLSVTDSLGGQAQSAPITVKVAMNSDPIELSVSDVATHVGFEFSSATPVHGNELGTVTYFSPDALGLGLKVDAATGVVSGKVEKVMDAIINVSIRDTGTLRVTSRPMKLQILPPVEVVLPQKITLLALEQMTAIAPSVQYAVGAMTWDAVSDPSALPPGVVFDQASGRFTGMPTELGTFGPVTVSGTDSVGGRGESGQVTFEIRPGAKFIGLKDATLPDGEKRSQWSYDFSTLATIVGFEPADLEWSVTAPSSNLPPAGLSAAGPVLSGAPNKSGDHTIIVKVKPKDPASTVPEVTKTYALKVTLPETSITLPVSVPDGEAVVAYSYDLKSTTTLKNVPLESVNWSLVLDRDPSTLPDGAVNGLPPGMTLNTTHQTLKGLLSGTPTKGGTYIFSVKAQFKDSEEDVSAIREYTVVITGAKFRFKSVDAGASIGTCGVTTDNRVACWGNNSHGQLGDGTVGGYKLVPVYVSGVSGAKAVAVGTTSACAIVNGGSVKCWGRGANGALGDGTGADSAVPVEVAGITSATTIDGYQQHYCVGLAGGGAKCWGVGTSGQLGNGIKAVQGTPVDVAGLTQYVKQLAVGVGNSCALLADSTVWCWGADTNDSLGNGSAREQLVPGQIAGLAATSISAGESHYCATTTSGSAKCWGRGNNWQLGPGININGNKDIPTQVSGLASGVRSVGLGNVHSCAVLNSGAVQCWGWDDNGQQGDGKAGAGGTAPPYGSNVAATQVVGLTSGAVMVTGGTGHTCAVMSDGVAKCWGAGHALGRGTTVNSSVPVDVGTE
jgi:Alpha-tubulin suppressor and related RCC1 domain-containing proteins